MVRLLITIAMLAGIWYYASHHFHILVPPLHLHYHTDSITLQW